MRYLLATLLWAAPVAAHAQPVAGPYVGLGGGVNQQQDTQVRAFSVGGLPVGVDRNYAFHPGYVGLGSIGYGLGNGLRFELEGSYAHDGVRRSPNTAGATSAKGHEDKYGPMGNALFDFDLGLPWLFPYVGAGAGYQWTHLTEQIAGPGAVANRGGTDGRFAYQAIAGLSVPIPDVPGLSLTAEYRFMGLAGDHTVRGERLTGCGPGCNAGVAPTASTPVSIKTNGDYNHSLLLGLRFAFGAAPEPVSSPVPVPVAAPAPAPMRSYLVFFDWDRADLTDRARQIVAEAAQASLRVAETRIEVDGHADRSGTVPYNQALGLRRAKAVAAELAHDGVPAQAINVQSFGESRPLVPTADGVREPQNRRVDIILK